MVQRKRNEVKHMKQIGTLYFFTGKMGAGKSTKAKQYESNFNAVLLSEDEWLSKLYPNQINTFDDYLNYAQQIKPLLKMHIQRILTTNTNVVMDFPGNTKEQRNWLLNIANEINADHQLIYLNISDEHCLQQISKRRLEFPERATFDTPETFEYVSSFFEEPHVSEGLNILEIN